MRGVWVFLVLQIAGPESIEPSDIWPGSSCNLERIDGLELTHWSQIHSQWISGA